MIATRKTVGYIIGLMFAAYTLCTHGQMTLVEKSAKPCSIYSFFIGAGDPVRFVPLQPLDLDIVEHALADGRYVADIPTGQPGRTIYVDAVQNGPPGEIPKWERLKLLVTGTAPDPIDPDNPLPPPLTGLAKQIYDLAAAVGRPDDARRMSQAFGSVASAIAAGGVTTLTEARAAITDQMRAISPLNAAWKPTGTAIQAAMNQHAQTVADAQRTLQAISDGLGRAGR